MLSRLCSKTLEDYIENAKRLDLAQVPHPGNRVGQDRLDFQVAWAQWKQVLQTVPWEQQHNDQLMAVTQNLTPHLAMDHCIWVPDTQAECRWYSPLGMAIAGLKVNTVRYTSEEALPTLIRLSLEASPLEPAVSWQSFDESPAVALGLPALMLWALYREDKPVWGPQEAGRLGPREEFWLEPLPCLPSALGKLGPLPAWKAWLAAHPQAIDALLVIPQVFVDLPTCRRLNMIEDLLNWGCVGSSSAWGTLNQALADRVARAPEASEFMAQRVSKLNALAREIALNRGLPAPSKKTGPQIRF